MIRSISTREFHEQRLSKSPSRRGIYINKETNKREVGTIFHSPYKDGKANKDYINPSFVSSHLFYPKEYLQSTQFVIKPSYIPNKNDIKKEELMQVRRRRNQERFQISKSKQKQIRKSRQNQKQRQEGVIKVKRFDDPENRLKAELQNLRNYRDNCKYEAKEDIEMSRQNKPANLKELELPIYFERYRKTYEYEEQQASRRRRQITEWNGFNNEVKRFDREKLEQANNKQNEMMDLTIQINRERKLNEEIQNRRNAQLLSNILKEQIRVNHLKREKRWMF